jgi:tetratricopeptide (TPR) repeat protein
MPDTSSADPEALSQITSVPSVSGGVNIDAQHDVAVGGDVVGRDKITHAEQINTGGGAYVGGSLEVNDHSTFAGRDVRTVSVSGNVNAPIVLGDVYGEVHLHAAAPVEISPPPPLPPLPAIVQFVGREAELAFYTQQLIERRWVVISGMAGAGKTALALELARRISTPTRIFWHAFHQGQGIQVVIWQLAAFLARHGQADLWHMLQLARQTGGQLPPLETLFDYLIHLVQGQDFLLCFDDIQLASDDPLLDQLFTGLRAAQAAGRFKIIMTARSLPDYASTFEFKPLTGLSIADTRQLLVARDLILPDALVTSLQARTDGNAQFLILAIDILRQVKDPDRVIERLAEADDIERYLVDEVYRRLGSDEQAVMTAVAVLLGYPATSNAIEAVLDGGNIRLTLRNLCDRYLLIPSDGEAGREYGQHAMVRAFFYELLGQRDRKVRHQRAGRYYETDESNLLRAALHYQRAGDHIKAAQLAMADVWASINLGQIHVLQDLLEHFAAQELGSELWVKINLARGQVYAVQGMGDPARESYQQGYSLLVTLPDTREIRELKARACRGMGELLEYESPQAALDWLRRGQTQLPDNSPEEEAALQIHIGTANMHLGNYTDAQDALNHGLALLSGGPSQLRSTALMNLGAVQFFQGRIQSAIEYALQGLEISRQLYDHFQSASILSNLGAYKFAAGDWHGALADFQEALALAERLGSKTIKASAEGNLGVACTNLGDDQSALEHFVSSLELARQSGLHLFEGIAQFHLSDLHVRTGAWEAAALSLKEAERLVMETGARANLPEIYSTRAEIELARGHLRAALDWAEQSVGLARELEMNIELGIGFRVLGKVQSANGRFQEAAAAFERSRSLLDGHDRYEVARTNLHWGIALISSDKVDDGLSLVQAARLTFADLGAKRDLKLATEILQ